MSIANRIKSIRESKELNQREFSAKIKIAQGTLAQFETGTRTVKDIHITAICREFNVNENWLRTGQEPMFSEQAISLDEFARQNDLDEIETEIIKVVMSIPKSERKKVIDQMRRIFLKGEAVSIGEIEQVATVEPEIKPVAMGKEENKEVRPKKYIPVSTDAEIEAELADYRKELEAEKKGQSACVDIKETKVAKAK